MENFERDFTQQRALRAIPKKQPEEPPSYRLTPSASIVVIKKMSEDEVASRPGSISQVVITHGLKRD